MTDKSVDHIYIASKFLQQHSRDQDKFYKNCLTITFI